MPSSTNLRISYLDVPVIRRCAACATLVCACKSPRILLLAIAFLVRPDQQYGTTIQIIKIFFYRMLYNNS